MSTPNKSTPTGVRPWLDAHAIWDNTGARDYCKSRMDLAVKVFPFDEEVRERIAVLCAEQAFQILQNEFQRGRIEFEALAVTVEATPHAADILNIVHNKVQELQALLGSMHVPAAEPQTYYIEDVETGFFIAETGEENPSLLNRKVFYTNELAHAQEWTDNSKASAAADLCQMWVVRRGAEAITRWRSVP